MLRVHARSSSCEWLTNTWFYRQETQNGWGSGNEIAQSGHHRLGKLVTLRTSFIRFVELFRDSSHVLTISTCSVATCVFQRSLSGLETCSQGRFLCTAAWLPSPNSTNTLQCISWVQIDLHKPVVWLFFGSADDCPDSFSVRVGSCIRRRPLMLVSGPVAWSTQVLPSLYTSRQSNRYALCVAVLPSEDLFVIGRPVCE